MHRRLWIGWVISPHPWLYSDLKAFSQGSAPSVTNRVDKGLVFIFLQAIRMQTICINLLVFILGYKDKSFSYKKPSIFKILTHPIEFPKKCTKKADPTIVESAGWMYIFPCLQRIFLASAIFLWVTQNYPMMGWHDHFWGFSCLSMFYETSYFS